ncbi:aminotransferase class I/II-fold pyridoxal phosphate-dependent enzyme [Patescibacteria group bacterium AH-259-L05]|nr:aminotransferase class I/II-fold pyridoxal phosphate-dependent enzyme [Patescibacteria group bacterium AH-259-L05]
MKLAERMNEIGFALTAGLIIEVNKRKAAGKDVIDLGLGDINFGHPPAFITAVIEAVQNHVNAYTEPGGPSELREAISIAHNQHYSDFYKDKIIQPDYNPDEIVYTTSAKFLIVASALSLANPGDEIIILAPYWPPYIDAFKLPGAVPRICHSTKENNFFPSPQYLNSLITNKTKGIIINTPHNPTGRVYRFKELKCIADIAQKYDLAIISDEVYDTLIFDNNVHMSIASLDNDTAQRTVVIKGLSKGFGMGGMRFGYAMSKNPELITSLKKVVSNTITCGSSILQTAAPSLLLNSIDHVITIREEFEKRVKFSENVLSEYGIQFPKVEGGIYVFADISPYLDRTMPTSTIFAEKLVSETGVVVLAGGACGNDNYIRIALIQDVDMLKEAYKRLTKFINKHG